MPLPDDKRAEEILRQLNRLPERPRSRPGYGWMIFLLALVLAGSIVAVVAANRQKFALAYERLAHPDSLP